MSSGEGPGRVGELRAWLKWLEGLDEEALGRILKGPPPIVGEMLAQLVRDEGRDEGRPGPEAGSSEHGAAQLDERLEQVSSELETERVARRELEERASSLEVRLEAENAVWPEGLRHGDDGLRSELRASLSGDPGLALLGTRLEAAVRRLGLLSRLPSRAERDRESGAVARELSSLLPEWFEAQGTGQDRQAELLSWVNDALGDAVSIQSVSKTSSFDSKKHSRREGSGSRIARVVQFILLRGDGRVLQRALVDLK